MACRRWLGWLGVTTALAWMPVSTAKAGHCDYCNEPLPSTVEIGATEIGTDGVVVVVLRDARYRPLDPTWWDVTTITVTDALGMPVDGSLELHPGFAAAAWRPTEPWSPGIHRIDVTVDLPANSEFHVALDSCLPMTHRSELVVIDEPRHVVGTRTISATESYRADPVRELDTLVCCDGALPTHVPVSGVLCPGYPSTELKVLEGYCTELLAWGTLMVDAELLIDGAPASRDYTLREISLDRTSSSGEARVFFELSEPRCLELEVLDLVTGERTIHESCHGEAIADELGQLDLDPTDELAAECSSSAYVCEVYGHRMDWDPDACTPWPPAEALPDEGCSADGCWMAAPSSGSSPWLLALVLLGLRRLRSRS